MELFELIQTLNRAHGPSGDEGEIREVIRALAEPYADEITADTMGSLIVHRRGKGPKLLLAAHMDSIGFVVTHIEKEGFLRVGRLGGVSPKEAAYTPVRFKSGLRGVFAPEEKADFGKLKLDECFLDIGAGDEAAAKQLVQVGDSAVYDTPAFRTGDLVVSPYLDDRISCAVLLSALERIGECPNDLYLVFTAQEEVGLRGARTAAWSIAPDYAVAVDVTDVDDTPGSERAGTARLGRGAAVKVMDSSVICHPAMVALLDGRGDAFSTDNTEVLAWAKSNKGFKVGITHLGDDDTIAPAVQKGNTELLNFVNDEIVKLGKDNFFHKDYQETLEPVYGNEVNPDDIVVEGGAV